MSQKTNVYIVSEHSLLRRLLCSFLNSKGNMTVLGEAADGETAGREILRLQPQLVLLDIDLPGVSGLELTGRIMAELPATRIIAVTERPESAWLIDFLRLGGMGYLHDCRSEAGVLSAIQEVLDGRLHLEYAGIKRLADFACENKRPIPRAVHIGGDVAPDILSERERQVLHLYARGYNSADMSSILFLSASTVSTYIRRIREKLRLEHKADLIEYAVRYDLYDDWK